MSELDKVNRDNADNVKKFVDVYSGHLHPSHVFLLQLKLWMFQGTFSRGGRSPIFFEPELRPCIEPGQARAC